MTEGTAWTPFVEHIEQILAARAAQEQLWNSYQHQLAELVKYSHRVDQAGRDPQDIYTRDD
jgi:hypothetical protein